MTILSCSCVSSTSRVKLKQSRISSTLPSQLNLRKVCYFSLTLTRIFECSAALADDGKPIATDWTCTCSRFQRDRVRSTHGNAYWNKQVSLETLSVSFIHENLRSVTRQFDLWHHVDSRFNCTYQICISNIHSTDQSKLSCGSMTTNLMFIQGKEYF